MAVSFYRYKELAPKNLQMCFYDSKEHICQVWCSNSIVEEKVTNIYSTVKYTFGRYKELERQTWHLSSSIYKKDKC